MGTKAHIRKEILQKRNQLLFTEQVDKSKAITEILVNMKAFIESDFILLYENYKNEVMTNDIFKIAVSAGKKVAYPRVDGDDMDFYVVNTKAQLYEGYKGIFEPDESCEIVDTEDISIHARLASDCSEILFMAIAQNQQSMLQHEKKAESVAVFLTPVTTT